MGRVTLSLGWSLVGLLALTTAAAASPVRLRGSVTDENNLPVAGVAITVQTSDGQTRTTYTDGLGRFELGPLSAGESRVSLSKGGFFRVADQSVQLSEGTNEVSFTLHHETELHETVEVVASANGVEPQETTHRETLVAHEVRDIPVPSTHDLKSSLPALPGVVRDNSNQFHLAGARVGQTQLQLDGFEIGDPATGDLTARVNVDAIRAIEVEAGRYGAQYPHAGAGVLSLDTTTGDDRWRFGITNFIPGVSFDRGTHFGNWYPRVTFSGPLAEGRVWFSDGVSVQHTFKVISELPPGADIAERWGGDNLFRVQANLTPQNILQGSFLYNQSSQSHLGLGAFAPLTTTRNQQAHRAFFSLKDQLWFGSVLLELGAAGDVGRRESSPQGSGTYFVTPTGTSGNYFEATNQRAHRWQFVSNLFLPSRRWHGSHDISAGVNVDEVIFHQAATRGEIDTERADNSVSQKTTFSGPSQFRLSNTQMGAYAQDSWRVARPLLVQFGLRADWDRLVQQAAVGPRVVVNILPLRDDRAKLALSWGIFYQPLDLVLWSQALDQQRSDVFYDSSGNPILGPVVSRFVLPGGGLKQPRFHTVSIEWAQRIGPRTFAKINLLGRNEHLGIAYEDLQPGQPGGQFLLQNNRRDRYRAAEVSLRHSFNANTEVYADYTRSRARSSEVLDYPLGLLVFAPQAPGPLPWDTPNRFLSWGWTPLPIWRLWFSYFLEYRTGFPFSVLDEQQRLVGLPNRLRFPDYVSVNIAVEKRFRLRAHEWAFRLAVLNLTGHANPESVINNIAAPNFLTFAGGQHRAFSGRFRLVGRK